MIRKITPQFNGSTHSTQVLTLEGVRFRLDVYSNKFDDSWYIDVFDDQDSPIVEGIAIASGLDLLFPYQYLPVPPGQLFVNTQTGGLFDPTLDTWEEQRADLYYQESVA